MKKKSQKVQSSEIFSPLSPRVSFFDLLSQSSSKKIEINQKVGSRDLDVLNDQVMNNNSKSFVVGQLGFQKILA